MPTIVSILAAAAWIGAAAVAAVPLFVPAGKRPAFTDYGVAATVGACAIGALWIVGLAVGGTTAAVAFAAAGTAIAALWTVCIRRHFLLPNWRIRPRCDGFIAIAFLVWASPFIAGSVIMAPGGFPARFFNVDTPFRLVHARELHRARSFPPDSLSNAGIRSGNHYGGPAVAAAVARLSALPVHTALFGVVLPVGVIGLFSATLMLSRRLASGRSAILEVVVLLLLLTTWMWPAAEMATAVRTAISNGSAARIGDTFAALWRDTQSFNNYFEDATHLFGRALFLVACIPLVAPSRRTVLTGAVAVVLLGQVKTGHAVIGGLALASAAALDTVRRRRLMPLMTVAMCAAVTLLFITIGGVGGLFHVGLEPFWMARHFPSVTVRQLGTFAIIAAVPIAVALAATGRDIRWNDLLRYVTPLLVTMCAIYSFFNIVGASWPGRSWVPGEAPTPEPFAAFLEPLLQMHTLFGLITAAAFAALWAGARPAARAVMLAAIAILVMPAMVHRIRGAAQMVSSPEAAHEHADNRPIGAALAAIPLEHSIVATNDLRYPANNYGRDLMQYQIPSVFGHQAFGLAGYDRYAGWEERVLLQRQLAAAAVACGTLHALRRNGVTHLLLHKAWEHPATLPLEKTFESSDYVVYTLERAPVCD